MADRILTRFVYPPIPWRIFDWCAYREGHEEDGDYGWGSTKEEAIDRLLKIEAERDDDQADAIVQAFEPLSKLARK